MIPNIPVTSALEDVEARELAACLEAAPATIREALRLGYEWRGRVLAVWAPAIDVPMFNRALGIGLTGFARRDEVAEIAARFASEGSPRAFFQITPDASPPELRTWLTEEGFAVHNRWARLWRRTGDLPASGSDVRVEQVGPERARLFGEIFASGFNLSGPVVDWVAALVGRPAWRHYLGYLGDEPVGTAALMADGPFAWLGYAATVERARRHGVQSALIARRLADAARLGCAYATLETAEDTPQKAAPSFRNVTRLGFQLAYLRENWVRAHSPTG